ncbi:Bax inhibitor-1/YccA family protein [Alicyclobacillus shizuokensis]|uniref:Bax inhibitor-1/YccA family protein n=1 Tax=Alicyclobacillus shizuokensis TaxID=392014 RepID=UPI00083669D2|nr:Bax inhibitor-1 family protein [Alicyclobacillus shizuokensis]MCL6626744.1 Bax inhibitor-1 family protein [Alicyclobacillus shizuokensis]
MELTLSRQRLMSKVFFGLFLSLLSAFVGLGLGRYLPPALLLAAMVAEVVMIIVAMFVQRSRRIGMGFVLVFTFVSGLTLYPVIAVYASQLGATLVLEAAGVTAATFFISALVAARSDFDFSFLSGFLFIALLALLLMGVVSLFISFSTVAQLIYCVLGIAVFVGYVLFDINRMARHGVVEAQVPWVVLSLYLDVLNLFLFILRLMGVLQSSRD